MTTLLGRVRYIPEIHNRSFTVRGNAERMATNAPIQGTAADILKRAMIDVDAALRKANPQARMILTVHDELLFEVPAPQAEDVAAIVREQMQNAAELNVPLTVDVGIAENWREAKR